MALTLPIEDMSRLQVAFKVSLPDGGLTFEMAPTTNHFATSCEATQGLCGLRLHFQSASDEGGLLLRVWASSVLEALNPEDHAIEVDSDEKASHFLPDFIAQELTASSLMSTNHVPSTLPSSPSSPFSFTPQTHLSMSPNTVHEQSLHPDARLCNWSNTQSFDEQMPVLPPPFESAEDKWSDFPHFGYGAGQTSTSPTQPQYLQHTTSVNRVHVPKAFTSPALNTVSEHHNYFSSNHHSYPSPSHPAVLESISSPDSDSNDRFEHHDQSSPWTEPLESPVGRSSYSTTILDHNYDSSRPYPCLSPDCDRWFKRDYTRKVHMLTHRRNKDKKPFVCSAPSCAERFSRKHDRLRHEVGRHGIGSEWNCDLCSRFFSSKATMERHLLDKHGVGQRDAS